MHKLVKFIISLTYLEIMFSFLQRRIECIIIALLFALIKSLHAEINALELSRLFARTHKEKLLMQAQLNERAKRSADDIFPYSPAERNTIKLRLFLIS